MRRILVDLTAWVRGPWTGVGLAAWRCSQALKAEAGEGVQVECFSRDGAMSGLSRIGPTRRLFGWRRAICHSFDSGLSRALLSQRVLSVHDLWTLRETAFQSDRFRRHGSPRLRRAIARADLVITPSEYVRRELVERFPAFEHRSFAVPWGPLLAFEAKGPVTPEVEAYLLERRPFALCVSTLEARKNLETLCLALEGNRELDLVLVGSDGHGVEAVRAAVGRLRGSSVRCEAFRGVSTTSLFHLYSASRIYVSASREEGFGMPVLEAMSAGRPLVLSEIPPFREIAGPTAFYFPLDGGPAALREAVHAALGPQGETRAGQGQERSLQFSWESTARRLLALYERLA